MKLPLKKQKPASARRTSQQDNPAVFSYYARGSSPSNQNTGRNQNQTPRTNKQYRPRLGHIPSYIALVAILLALGRACLLDATPKIVLVQMSGTVHRDAKAYQEGIEDIWSQSLFSRSKLTVSTSKIEQEIDEQFPELSDIEIELPLLGNRPTVRITPSQPALELVTSRGSFYVSDSGEVLARTSDLVKNDTDNLAIINDESDVPAEPGKTIIPATQVSFLQRLYAQLRAESVAITSITLSKTAANQADLRVDGQTYYVKFSLDSDPRQAVGTYIAAKTKFASEGTKLAEYMDVRVPEKVFYK